MNSELMRGGIFEAVNNTDWQAFLGMAEAVNNKRQLERQTHRDQLVLQMPDYIDSTNKAREAVEDKHEVQRLIKKYYHTPYVNNNKVGRNEPCPCGSGKKYKNCCGKLK